MFPKSAYDFENGRKDDLLIMKCSHKEDKYKKFFL